MVLAGPGKARSLDFFQSFTEIAHDPETRRNSGFVWDNDAFFFSGRGTDHFYTNGFLMERQYLGQGYYVDDPSGRFVRASEDQLAALQAGAGPERTPLFRQLYGIHFGQNIYTPSDIRQAPGQLDPRDRPYAAWFYLGMYREVIAESNASLRYGLDIGILGPAARGEEVQKAVHRCRLLHAEQPQGWDTQIRNEWGLVFFVENTPVVWDWSIRVNTRYMEELTLELSPDLRLNAGNIFVNAQAGARIRVGQLNAAFRQPHFTGNINPSIAPVQPMTAPDPRREYYLFWAITGHAVGYNGTIEGSPVAQTPRVHPELFVYDTEVGGAYHGLNLLVSYSITVRSSEVKEQSSKFPQHRFGRFVVSWEY